MSCISETSSTEAIFSLVKHYKQYMDACLTVQIGSVNTD